jgi:deoxyribodipyrimidine photo-lyase
LYVYEPSQLLQPSVHGSHVLFHNEGLLDFDAELGGGDRNILQCLTVCYAEVVDVLNSIHERLNLVRLLAHEETGNFASYQRDRLVRRWCKTMSIPFMEFQQSGVTRRLKDRDDFSKLLNAFMAKPQHPTPDPAIFKGRILGRGLELPGQTSELLGPDAMSEIPEPHKVD